MSEAVIRWAAWYGDHDLSLAMPDGWTVIPCPPHDGPDIGADGIAAAFANPIGTPTLRQLAEGRVAPCIVVDDLSRPTPGDRLIPPILAELAAAGIPGEDVLILAGTANHRTLTAEDLRKKLGDVALSTCRIAMHFSWDGCEVIGETAQGSVVEINSDFLRSDLRILVGSIIPHGATGFSGGAKLLMPGIASIRSAIAFHEGTARHGVYADPETDARHESEEAGRLAGVDFIVNGIPNSQRGLAAVVCGDLVAAHRAGAARAAEVFATATPVGCDVAVFSLYPKDTEFIQHITALAPWKTAPAPIVREGGTIVIAAAATEGFGFHSLFGPGMRLAAPRATRVRDRDLVFFSPGMAPGCLPANSAEGTTMFPTWEQTRSWLEAKHGPSATVAVFPCATIQLASPERVNPGRGL